MKYLKLFEQFEDNKDWWEKESPFDNIDKNLILKIVRVGGSHYYIGEIIRDSVRIFDDVHTYPISKFDINPIVYEDTEIDVYRTNFVDEKYKYKDLPKEIKDRLI